MTNTKKDDKPVLSLLRAIGLTPEDTVKLMTEFQELVGHKTGKGDAILTLSSEEDLTKIFDKFKGDDKRNALVFFYLGYSIAHVDNLKFFIDILMNVMPKPMIDDLMQTSMMFFEFRVNQLIGNQKMKFSMRDETDVGKSYQ